MEKLLYEKLSNERNPEFNIVTDIVERDGKRLVIKRPYEKKAISHIHRVYGAYEGLSKIMAGSQFCVNKSVLVGDSIESEFLEGECITSADSAKYVEAVTKAYMPVASAFVITDDFIKVFGEVELPIGVLAAKYVDIDLIFENIINTKDGWQVIDYEWTFDFPIPINYIFYRAEKFSCLPANTVVISDEEREVYEKMEDHFQSKYCFKDVKNLHEIREHIASQNKSSADFTIASRDYQIKQLQELVAAKDVHIRNIEAVNSQLRTIYDNTVNTKGYRMLENFRAFKAFFSGKPNSASEAKKAAKAEAKAAKAAQKSAQKAAKKGENTLSIAVHLHLFYVDLLPEFISYFENIPFKFDLYISCQEGADVAAITAEAKQLKQVQVVDVRALPNRGRDLAPLYVKFADDILKHDYFLHVHSKKSLYSGVEKGQWRQYCLEVLLGSIDRVSYIFELFKDQNAGLIYPDIHQEVPTIAYSWLKNEQIARDLLKDFGITDLPSTFNYPAGSFFWARTDALRPLLERGLSYDDFPREQGQTDGTLAHALERLIPFISRKQGYDDFILYLQKEDTQVNKSLRPYNNIFKVDQELLTMKLGAYDTVSFDIFDTLIARTVYDPNDVFRLMEKVIAEKYGKKVDFLKIRKAAEEKAVAQYGAYTNIDKIYTKLADDPIVGDLAPQLKKLEIDTEFRLCVPRKDMVAVYNAVKKMGRRVILVSDMYLNKAHIVAMLHKCGITGYDEIFLSCEVGARKDDGSIWDLVFAGLDSEKFIHVGDNFCSDSQILMDRGVDSQLVLNSRALLEISDFSYLRKYATESVANSIMLGQAISGGLFNSPFAFDENGKVKFKNIYDFGYSTMGPLLSYFTQWVNNTAADSKERLLLLSREGYMLEQLIKAYCQARGEETPDIRYFLASRRACAVPALENDEDLKELISQKYEGSFSNLLNERLGLELHDGDEDIAIDYSTKPETIMEHLAPYKEELLDEAAKEKNAYLVYAKEFIADASDIAVVDVGFSGTIQYFLMKLTGRDIAGHYLCLHSNKPERIGGRADAIYEIKDARLIDDSKLLRYQLFLENALSAPYGQLICFTMKDGQPLPNYKKDDKLSEEVKQLQKGILDFAAQFGAATKGAHEDMTADKALVEDIFYDIIAAGTLTEDIAASLTVEDGYSRGGIQKFDVHTGSWKVN